MTKTVLAAIDLIHKDLHGDILGKAAKFAELDDARLVVVTVIPDFGMSIVGTYFDEDAEKKALTQAATDLHSAVTEQLGESEDKQIKHVVCHGNAYEEILETADKFDVNLIVMGAHAPKIRDYLLGPNAARVVRHSTCSVFVVR